MSKFRDRYSFARKERPYIIPPLTCFPQETWKNNEHLCVLLWILTKFYLILGARYRQTSHPKGS